MTGHGRGRGEGAKLARVEENPDGQYKGVSGRPGDVPMLDVEKSSSSGSQSGSDRGGRGRAGFKKELRTIPKNIKIVHSQDAGGQPIEVVANYVKMSSMSGLVYQYRVDYEPDVESLSLRRRLFNHATAPLFSKKVIFDGMYDARSSEKSSQTEIRKVLEDPFNSETKYTVIIKLVGSVNWAPAEVVRVYNMNMKSFFRALGYFTVSKNGAYVHPRNTTAIGDNSNIVMVRGYRTAVNVHEKDELMMNLEAVHKIMQRMNVLQTMNEIRQNCRTPNFQEALKAQLIGKLVVTNYNKIIYRVEDIRFNLNPTSTFRDDKAGRDVTYTDYFKEKYGVEIKVSGQPLLLVIQNNRRQEQAPEDKEILLVPELCNIAGLTDQQRANNRLKMDLIRSSQVSPDDRVSQLKEFLNQLHTNRDVVDTLTKWNYKYDKELVTIKARILPTESIGVGRSAGNPPNTWPKVDNMGSFDSAVQRENLAVAPNFPKMAIILSRADLQIEGQILSKLKGGFDRIGLRIGTVETIRMSDGDSAHHFTTRIRSLSNDFTAAMVIMPTQNKERYDAIKKVASVERGLITQVVTSRLMMDPKKASGAAIKIGVQVAAKVGGEPWYISIPLSKVMICGYDTSHDTANRGKSFGAFVASMNPRFSKWFSKADAHDRLDELSANMASNLSLALQRYKELNQTYPERVFIYRDGVGDGQLDHVFNVELKAVRKAISELNANIRLAFTVVNKRIGARFYMKVANGRFVNPPPGSVIDNVITRKERYDYYLVSQSTRHGVVTPTYYNILCDDSGLDPSKHQMMSFKLCFLYYNWTGTVRVPAPCQYAHKLALICGENLHSVPNAVMDDKLHFL